MNSANNRLNAPVEVVILKPRRAQVEDVGADVADRAVERVEGSVEPFGGAADIAIHKLSFDVLEGQPDGIDRLDHAVVKIHADALTFLNDAQRLHGLVQARVFNGDAGMRGEQLDDQLIFDAELVGRQFVGEVEVAQAPVLATNGHAQEAGHLGMVGREAH